MYDNVVEPAFSSCSVGPKYASPCMEIPCDWNSELSDGMDTEKEMPDCFLWWEFLMTLY